MFHTGLKEETQNDITSAFLWNEVRLEGPGEQFLRELDTMFEHLRKRPKAFQTTHKEFRRAPLKRFPYVIIYTIDGKTIVIYRVFHTDQNPAHWKKQSSH